ncbi:hypothetical protein GLOIN_2v1769896 [Rhizophagus clarus]|uniref:Ion transport domain-containing protein n=1 Tax=Rhizophagus clarus TaxID=94130 RepID=A0A8H3QLW6_9GLOM|nr:hypothetical protein GLOIN_2v1769896 [Rhizophagus clarus]
MVLTTKTNLYGHEEKCERDYLEGRFKKLKYSSNAFDDDFTVNLSPQSENENNNKIKKGIAIYHLELENQKEEDEKKKNKKEIRSNEKENKGKKKIKEMEKEEKEKEENYDLITNNFEFNVKNDFEFFDLNEKFEYPPSIKRELKNWYTSSGIDCMDRLLSCIYDKYFLATQYKNDAQSLEVYNLEKMELESIAKKVESENKFASYYYPNNFTISRLQLCFTRGNNTIKLYYIENGLEIASKTFKELRQINLLEFFNNDEKLLIIGRCPENELKFIIWDLYDTGKVELTWLDNFPVNFNTRLARTSGNILQIDDDGKVLSVLKKIDREIKKDSKFQASNIELKDERRYGQHNHIIHYDKNIDFKPIVENREPWVLDDYERNSYCLYQKERETLQLIVGRSTVQIWHRFYDSNKTDDELPNRGDPFLEYIWANSISVNQERNKTRLQIEEFKYGSNDPHDELCDFYLKVYWYERKDYEESKEEYAKKKDHEIIKEEDDEIKEIERKLKEINDKKGIDEGEKEKEKQEILKCYKIKRKEKVINRKDVIENFHVVKHACRALEHLNKRHKRKRLADNYIRVHEYEEMIKYIKHIIWRFIKHEPESFKLLDVRYNIMKSLILSDCDQLIKFILFGDEEEKRQKFTIRHIPRNKLWSGKKFITNDDDLDFESKDGIEEKEKPDPKNNLELAIYHCKDRELKDTIIIAYLLEYYSNHATDCAGWMCTVSKAIPLLFKYNYAQDPNEIIPAEYRERRNHNIKFRAFRPIIKLNSLKSMKSDINVLYLKIVDILKTFKSNIIKKYENLDNDLGKSPLALRVVPLPDFTKNNTTKDAEYGWKKIVLNLFLIIFIPRWYKIRRNDRNQLSPFSRMILYENNDDIYDNPATEAVIDFRWQKARNFFFSLLARFVIFATCFGLISWAYLNHDVIINGNFLFTIIVIFYYLAVYQLITEALQFKYRGFKKYFGEIFNIFDIISITLSVTIMSMMLKNFQFSDGFGSVKEIDIRLVVGISFSVFLLWVELIFYLRQIPGIGSYIYYVNIIFKTIFPFFLFMLIVILAFAHTMFVLLRNPINIKTKDSTYSGDAINTTTNETLNIALKADFDPTSSDNPFTTFSGAIIATYFWISGNMVQRDQFDYWAVDAFTLIASIILVIVLQNVLIAFMSGVYEKAENKGRQTLLRYQANHIADYEAIQHIHFWEHEHDPKYIYYFGQSKNFEDWYNKRKDQGPIYKELEGKSTFIKHICVEKKRNFDKYSILKYDVNINTEFENIINKKNELNDYMEYLAKKINELKNKNEIKENLIDEYVNIGTELENIKNKENYLNEDIKYLAEKINEMK